MAAPGATKLFVQTLKVDGAHLLKIACYVLSRRRRREAIQVQNASEARPLINYPYGRTKESWHKIGLEGMEFQSQRIPHISSLDGAVIDGNAVIAQSM